MPHFLNQTLEAVPYRFNRGGFNEGFNASTCTKPPGAFEPPPSPPARRRSAMTPARYPARHPALCPVMKSSLGEVVIGVIGGRREEGGREVEERETVGRKGVGGVVGSSPRADARVARWRGQQVEADAKTPRSAAVEPSGRSDRVIVGAESEGVGSIALRACAVAARAVGSGG